MAEDIAARIIRLRNSKGWSRPELGRKMAQAVGRKNPFSGEAIRRYEERIDEPSRDARAALAKAFDKSEAYIEFGPGSSSGGATKLEQPSAPEYLTAEERALIASYRKADSRWQLSIRLLAALADPDDQVEAATDVNMVVARILGKKPKDVRYASNERVAQAFGEAPHVAARKAQDR